MSGAINVFLVLVVFACGSEAGLKHHAIVVKPTSPYPLKKLTNFEICGGTGKVTEVREEGCELIPGGACRYFVDPFPRNQELDIIAASDVSQVGVRSFCKDGKVLKDTLVPESAIKAGQKYTVEVLYTIDAELKGQKGVGRLEVYDPKTSEVVVCVESPFEIS